MQSSKKEEEEGWTGGQAVQEQQPQGWQKTRATALYSSTGYKSNSPLLESLLQEQQPLPLLEYLLQEKEALNRVLAPRARGLYSSTRATLSNARTHHAHTFTRVAKVCE